MRLLVILLFVVSVAFSETIELNPQDFIDGRVVNRNGETNGEWFIKFYNPECSIWKEFKSSWEKLANEYEDSGIQFGNLSCLKYNNVWLAYGVEHYPGLIYIKESKYTKCSDQDYTYMTKYLDQEIYDEEIEVSGKNLPDIA